MGQCSGGGGGALLNFFFFFNTIGQKVLSEEALESLKRAL
jgi:hypothetical protein